MRLENKSKVYIKYILKISILFTCCISCFAQIEDIVFENDFVLSNLTKLRLKRDSITFFEGGSSNNRRPATQSAQSQSSSINNLKNSKNGANRDCKTQGGVSGRCQNPSKCSLFLSQNSFARSGAGNLCQINSKKNGICCPIITKNREIPKDELVNNKPRSVITSTRLIGDSISVRINAAANKAIEDNKKYMENEKKILDQKGAVKKGTSSHGHLLFFQTSKRAIKLSKLGYNLLESTRDLSTRLGINKKESGEGLQDFNIKNTALNSNCPITPTCDRSKVFYRSADGSCNNLKFPALGASFTPLYRILNPDYADGIWSPRVAVDSTPLPSARLLSSVFNPDSNAPDSRYSLFVMQFGQFIDHDFSHVPINRFFNGSGIECCSESGDFLPPSLTHPFCLPIQIPPNDPFYSKHGQRCMNFVRSMVGPRIDCSLGYGDQLSQITHWLDNSNIYGSSEEELRELRLFRDGKLRTGRITSGSHNNNGFSKGMLPLQEREGDECTVPDRGTHCFAAGDLRVNEMIGLSATHLIWFREHNRIVSLLQSLHTGWSDEKLFSEGRRIVNAEYQHIIYNEWLPIVVGREFMEVYGILPLSTGYATDYDERIDPSVSNAFAAAAFRMGHTLIQGILELVNEVGRPDEYLEIHKHFNNPFRLREEGLLDKLIRGLTQEPIQSFDPFVTREVTNRLFQPRNRTFGMDLVSLNIQRARDHGIPGYNLYREACKLGRVKNFQQLRDKIPENIASLLSKYYKSVDDIDLFIGGIVERPIPGALLGPTFTCIIGDQFARAKKSDRFAYDLGGFSHSFTPNQLEQIRLTSFARILCDNSDNIRQIQPLAFFLPNGEFNPIISCESEFIPRLDISYW